VIVDKDVLDTTELEAVPRAFVVVNRKRFRLTVYRRVTELSRKYEKAWSCPVAIGAIGYATPTGPFFVLAKARNPDWTMPNSDWVAEDLRGTTIPGGAPENPIKAAFLKLTMDGVGIHGTDNLLSLGTKASHGCVRVRPAAARHLYHIVPVGAPVYIK
jgi:lipoprotein-anchoring transpeptidase ErfK/SrfK